jgi:hypothetical protein
MINEEWSGSRPTGGCPTEGRSSSSSGRGKVGRRGAGEGDGGASR